MDQELYDAFNLDLRYNTCLDFYYSGKRPDNIKNEDGEAIYYPEKKGDIFWIARFKGSILSEKRNKAGNHYYGLT